MESKVKPIKLFLIIFILFLLFGIVGSILLRNYNERNYPERFVSSVDPLGDDYDKTFPQIVNEPSRRAFVGEVYSFTPRVAPLDNLTNLTLLDGPEWLVMDGSILTGIPFSIGTESFVLRIEKEGRYVDREFFLVINDMKNE